MTFSVHGDCSADCLLTAQLLIHMQQHLDFADQLLHHPPGFVFLCNRVFEPYVEQHDAFVAEDDRADARSHHVLEGGARWNNEYACKSVCAHVQADACERARARACAHTTWMCRDPNRARELEAVVRIIV